MGKLNSKKGKKGYLRYKTERRLETHKENAEKRRIRHLEKRKAWRIKKYSQTNQQELSVTSYDLFRKWGVPLVGPKRVKGKKGTK